MALAEQLQNDEQRLEGAADTAPAPSVRARAWRQAQASARAPILLALLFVTCVKQLVLTVAVAPFEGHDEVAHFGYLWTMARFGRLPTLRDNLPVTLDRYNWATLDWPAVYTATHPPLYYLLAWPVYQLAGPSLLTKLYLLRLVSVPFLLLTVWLAYALATALFPRDHFLALSVPAAVAFQPQLGFVGAIFNNDILSIFFGALLLYRGVLALRDGLTTCRAAALGVALGLGLLTKGTLTAFLPLVAGVALWCCRPRPWGGWRAGAYWRATLRTAAALVAPAVLLPLPWYLFLERTYGDFSAFGALQTLQAGWNYPLGTFGELLRSPAFHLERIHEYWGYFGWKVIPFPPGHLRVIHEGMLLCGVGFVVGTARILRAGWGRWRAGGTPFDATPTAGVLFLLAANVLMYGAMIYFGTMFRLTQARYVFPVATGTALLAMLSLRALIPRRLLRPATLVTIGALGAFNLLVFTQFVIGHWFVWRR